jgi:hypothetical protein
MLLVACWVLDAVFWMLQSSTRQRILAGSAVLIFATVLILAAIFPAPIKAPVQPQPPPPPPLPSPTPHAMPLQLINSKEQGNVFNNGCTDTPNWTNGHGMICSRCSSLNYCAGGTIARIM